MALVQTCDDDCTTAKEKSSGGGLLLYMCAQNCLVLFLKHPSVLATNLLGSHLLYSQQATIQVHLEVKHPPNGSHSSMKI